MARTFVVVALSLFAGCGAGVSSHPGACTPGQSSACACTDGRMGAQVCQSDGTYAACDCTGGGGGGGNKIVFITSATYSGDLATVAGQTNGLAAADRLCTTAAMAAGLGPAWRAWLSDASTNAIDRIADAGPWFLRDGTRVFNNKANLATTALAPININENGAHVQRWDGSNTHYVWTGTQIGGVRTNLTCSDWSSTAGMGSVGELDSAEQWTGNGQLDCVGITYLMHLYCLEQYLQQ
jgi:hypothetical protein